MRKPTQGEGKNRVNEKGWKEFHDAYQRFVGSGLLESLDYDKWNRMLLTCHSTAIEGATLSYEETTLLLNDDRTPKGKRLWELNMVADHYNALTLLLRQAEKGAVITEKFIKEIGAMVNKSTGKLMKTALGVADESKGDYRLVNVFAGKRSFMNYAKVPVAMKAFVVGLNERIKSLKNIKEIYECSFLAHYDLVNIHPFTDGNGRTSRLLMNYIQACEGVPLTMVAAEEREGYIQSLEAAREGGNKAVFCNFMRDQAVVYFEGEMKKVTMDVKEQAAEDLKKEAYKKT